MDQNHIGVVTLNSETDYAAHGWLETVPDPAVAVRPDGKIAAVNARAAALFGYTHDDLVGQPVDAIVSAGFTGVGLRQDDSTGSVAVALTSPPEAPAPATASATLTTVVPPASATPAPPAAIPAIPGPEDLGHLAGAVAHDVNNLLSVIRNYAAFVGDALEAAIAADRNSAAAGNGEAAGGPAAAAGGLARPEQLPGPTGPVDWAQMRHDVAQIQHAGERAAELTADLLAAVRRKAAGAGAVDLRAVVRGTAGLLRRPLGERIDVRVELDDDLWQVSSDPARLEQAIINLAMNARDAMPHGGTLTMTAGNVLLGDPPAAVAAGPETACGTEASPGTEARVATDAAADAVEAGGRAEARGRAATAGSPAAGGDGPRRFVSLQVTDTGTGMSLTTQARAFEPFFTTKPEGAGTGLGLAAVRDVVTQAGGEAWISSTLGVGTTVGLLLPACDPPVPPRSAPERTAAPDPAGAPTEPSAVARAAAVTTVAPIQPAAPEGLRMGHRRVEGPLSRPASQRRVRVVPAPAPSTVS